MPKEVTSRYAMYQKDDDAIIEAWAILMQRDRKSAPKSKRAALAILIQLGLKSLKGENT